jgi:hypothetical protein
MIRQDMELKSRHVSPAIKLFEGTFFAKVSTLAGSSKKVGLYRPIIPESVKSSPKKVRPKNYHSSNNMDVESWTDVSCFTSHRKRIWYIYMCLRDLMCGAGFGQYQAYVLRVLMSTEYI